MTNAANTKVVYESNVKPLSKNARMITEFGFIVQWIDGQWIKVGPTTAGAR